MKAVIRRLRRLEERLVPQLDHESERLANILRVLPGRRLEASGLPYKERLCGNQ
jgi:hypothetical protein